MHERKKEEEKPIWACDEEIEETLGNPIKTNIYGILQFGILIPIFFVFSYILLLYGPIYFGFMFIAFYGLVLLVFFNFAFKDFWSGREFIALYEDKFVINKPRILGFAVLPRKDYKVDVIGLETSLPEDMAPTKFMILIFNKPIGGLPYVLLEGRMYLRGERLERFIELTNPRHVLLNGKYYLITYAVFRYFYGDKYPELAETLLDDFSDIVEVFGIERTAEIMNALRSLCIAKREEEAVRLARLITTRAIIDGYRTKIIMDKVDGSLFQRWVGWVTTIPQPDGTVKELKTYIVELENRVDDLLSYPVGIASFIAGILWVALNYTPVSWFVFFWEAGITIFPVITASAYPVWSRFSLKSGIARVLAYRALIRFVAAIPVALVPYLAGAPEMTLYWNLILLGFLIWATVTDILTSDYPVYRAGLKTAEKIKDILRQ